MKSWSKCEKSIRFTVDVLAVLGWMFACLLKALRQTLNFLQNKSNKPLQYNHQENLLRICATTRLFFQHHLHLFLSHTSTALFKYETMTEVNKSSSDLHWVSGRILQDVCAQLMVEWHHIIHIFVHFWWCLSLFFFSSWLPFMLCMCDVTELVFFHFVIF